MGLGSQDCSRLFCDLCGHALAGGQALVEVDPQILQGMGAVLKAVTAGQGSMLVWPALLRKLERTDPGYKD